MKKLLAFALLIFALSGVASAATKSKTSIRPVDHSIVFTKITKAEMIQKEAPHVYIFYTTCGLWIMTTIDTPDMAPLGYVAVWASFQAACME